VQKLQTTSSRKINKNNCRTTISTLAFPIVLNIPAPIIAAIPKAAKSLAVNIYLKHYVRQLHFVLPALKYLVQSFSK
jgi:hypothetical protein